MSRLDHTRIARLEAIERSLKATRKRLMFACPYPVEKRLALIRLLLGEVNLRLRQEKGLYD